MDKLKDSGYPSEGGHVEMRSMVSENTIGFGQAVKYGTDTEAQVMAWDGAASTDIFAGVAAIGPSGDFENDQFDESVPVPVLRKGQIWVKISEDSGGVSVGDTAAVLSDGWFDKTPLSEATNGVYGVEISGSEFLSAAAAGGTALLSLNLPSEKTVKQL